MKFTELFALSLVIFSIAIILLIEVSEGLILQILYALDFAIALYLLYDYGSRVKKGGLSYAIFNSYEIVAYIPVILIAFFIPPSYGAILRALRILRFIALGIRLMREIQSRSAKLLGSALLLLFMSIFLGSTSFYFAEANEQNLNFFDCLYWAVITITTAGYGDLVPKTFVGKLIAMIIVLMGVAVVSLFTASILSIVLVDKESSVRKDLEELIRKHEKRAKVDEKELLEKIKKLLENDR
ncbi:MAG: potassium channel family protein [Archaeoglobaceae archaeon]|nr:potassium channel family protein [Archaeoglobaceae archaeon]MDW8128686.1 potassium channel family protein [Archaeoglobaceae archaeon]